MWWENLDFFLNFFNKNGDVYPHIWDNVLGWPGT